MSLLDVMLLEGTAHPARRIQNLMPTNKVIYFGLIVIAASALLWVGAWLARRIDWILPYSGIAGLVMVIVGMFLELRKKKEAADLLAPADGKGPEN